MSVQYQQPASMPAYHLPPHTPLQHQKSFGGAAMAQSTTALATSAAAAATAASNPSDPFYAAAPHSVPTPSKMPSNSLLQSGGAGEDSSVQEAASKLPPPLTSATRPQTLTATGGGARQPNAPPRLSASNQARTFTKQTSMVQPKTTAVVSKPAQQPPLKPGKPRSKLAQYVLHIPVPQTQRFQHERNQRFVVLYGFGAKKLEILDKTAAMKKSLLRLFARKVSIDLTDLAKQLTTPGGGGGQKAAPKSGGAKSPLVSKLTNRVTNMHYTLSAADTDLFGQITDQYTKLDYNDQYAIIHQVQLTVIDIYKTLDQKNFLPKLQYLQYLFDLMESNMNIFNLLLFAIRLLRLGPAIEAYLKKKLTSGQSKPSAATGAYFEYLSYFYLSLIGIFRLHLVSLCLWRDLATVVFKCLLRLVRHVERPSRCSAHEKCSFMLLTEMYANCSYIKPMFQTQFEPLSAKIKAEKVFNTAPSLEKLNLNPNTCQMRPDDQLTAMITTTEYVAPVGTP